MVDQELLREIHRGCGIDREHRFSFMRSVQGVRDILSDCTINDKAINIALIKYGRAAVAVCLASTIRMRRERLDGWKIQWANEVVDAWGNRGNTFVDRAQIDDWWLHPTKICEYAAPYIAAWTI